MRVIRLQQSKQPNTLTASFTYDPELVAIIKQVPGRTWDKNYKVWSLPDTPENIAWLQARLPKNVELRIDEAITTRAANTVAGIGRAQAARDKGDSDIVFDYLTTPYAHQRAGLEFLTHIGSGALLWEMGLGKTKTAIDYAEWLAEAKGDTGTPITGGRIAESFKVLVICPNTVKRNWAMEVPKHAGHADFILPSGTLSQRIRQLGTARYTIINCEVLSFKDFALALQGIAWDLVIVDESTRFKSPKASRTKALHKLRATHRLILTGTPVTNTAEDAWAQYHFIAPGLLGSWWSFTDRYLQKDYFGNVIGTKPHMVADLASRIESRSYRILKSEVLDLPPKVYTDRLVELTGEQAKAYASMRDDLRVQLASGTIEAYNILTQLLRLTQITAGLIGEGDRYEFMFEGNAKLAELDSILNEEAATEQVVIFGLYQKELEALALRYHHSGGIIYGPTPERVRAELIAEFQAGQRRLLFVQTRTGGLGINLTAAKNAVYFTRGWSLEDYLQSQDRLHRIGQTGTVNIVHLTAQGTVDEQIAKALASKQSLADALTGDGARRLAAEVLGDKK
jgi:SNF2 family DNA or RNA helicase